MNQDLKTKILSKVKDDLLNIETALHENLNPCLDIVSDIAGHLLFSGGKRLRPLLMVLSARMCGCSYKDEIDFSIIFEYLHAATLLHDDVVDAADMRRGKKAAHAKWSAPKVVLTGDFLLARSLTIASMSKIPQMIKIIAKITEEMSQGEIDQLARKNDIDLTEEEYMNVIRRKTAVLIQGACRSGAVFAHDRGKAQVLKHSEAVKREKALSDYGYHLGIAFQMADDLLDYTADAITMGKNPGADLREGKLTLPLIAALAKADSRDRLWMEKIIKASLFNENDFKNLTAMLYKYNGIEYTESKANYHAKKAKSCLDIFDASESKDVMMMLADYAVARKV